MISLSEMGISQIGRMAREPSIQTTAALASAPAAAAGLRAVGFSTDLDTAMLAQGMVDGALWMTIGLAALFGGLGGIVAELLSLHGNIELPHRVRHRKGKRSRFAEPRDMIDLGIVSRILLGAAAALAILSVYAPTSPTALLVNALIAGSAAAAVFRLVQGRLLGKQAAQTAPRPRPIRLQREADAETEKTAA